MYLAKIAKKLNPVTAITPIFSLLNVRIFWQFEPENVLKMFFSCLNSISINQCAREIRNLSKSIICCNVVSTYILFTLSLVYVLRIIN